MLCTGARRTLFAAVWLAAAAAPLTAAAAASPAPPLATLAEPRPQQALVAGQTAVLAWSPGPRLARSRRILEWEAFLSVDGGAHYTVRLTPHLDRDLRRVSFHVPDLPTDDARILLRFGDERQETVLEPPQRFAIVRSSAVEEDLDLAAAPALHALRSGEPARPGEAGVRRWTEGSRRGGETREVEAAPAPGARGLADPPAAESSLDILAPEPPTDALAAGGNAWRAAAPPPRSAARRRAADPPLLAPDVLLLSRRRNE
jgi:hypothetical protein